MVSRSRSQVPNNDTGVTPDYSGASLEINVEDVVYHIPQNIICRSSDFFKNAAKPQWGGQPITLEEDTKQIFNLYTVWLYNGNIDRAESELKTWRPLTDAYVMGERFMDASFQAVILQAMIDRLRIDRKPDIDTMNSIYNGTSDPSPARRLMIDICLYEKRDCLRKVDNPVAELNEDLINDLLGALLTLPKPATTLSPWTTNAEQYRVSLIRDCQRRA